METIDAGVAETWRKLLDDAEAAINGTETAREGTIAWGETLQQVAVRLDAAPCEMLPSKLRAAVLVLEYCCYAADAIAGVAVISAGCDLRIVGRSDQAFAVALDLTRETLLLAEDELRAWVGAEN